LIDEIFQNQNMEKIVPMFPSLGAAYEVEWDRLSPIKLIKRLA